MLSTLNLGPSFSIAQPVTQKTIDSVICGVQKFAHDLRCRCHRGTTVLDRTATAWYHTCIRNDESAQAVHVTPGSLLDTRKTTMKRDTQSRYDDVDCSQAWLPRPLGRTRRFG
ncbi:hypothetical protein Y032_0992g3326 [Ancylostoma ceylanicum]|uniref:Uncharacterized protein n=1 Tax=Ancylostoma ceylanicum TaxID=53326 RepID=A0A016W9N5_9BILA|nr:hypothetical protein Y032_0992g3326 [Ancylostoma ceylanicum]